MFLRENSPGGQLLSRFFTANFRRHFRTRFFALATWAPVGDSTTGEIVWLERRRIECVMMKIVVAV